MFTFKAVFYLEIYYTRPYKSDIKSIKINCGFEVSNKFPNIISSGVYYERLDNKSHLLLESGFKNR